MNPTLVQSRTIVWWINPSPSRPRDGVCMDASLAYMCPKDGGNDLTYYPLMLSVGLFGGGKICFDALNPYKSLAEPVKENIFMQGAGPLELLTATGFVGIIV